MSLKPFKFLQKKPERVFTDYMDAMDDYFLGGIPLPVSTNETIKLHKYHKKLLSRYTYTFNLYPGQSNYHAGGMIYNTVVGFINDAQLTSYSEIRNYYKNAYGYLSNDTDIISNEDHDYIIRVAEYECQSR
jgi:hypothetical protein